MRLHLVGLPHTEFTDEFSWCAFTALGFTFSTMMTRQGHEVILYGGERTDADCAEFVACHGPVSTEFHVPGWTQAYFSDMNERVIEEMRERIRPCLLYTSVTCDSKAKPPAACLCCLMSLVMGVMCLGRLSLVRYVPPHIFPVLVSL